MFPELFPKYNSDMRQQAILQWQGPKGRVPGDEKDSKVEGRKDKSGREAGGSGFCKSYVHAKEAS